MFHHPRLKAGGSVAYLANSAVTPASAALEQKEETQILHLLNHMGAQHLPYVLIS